jgi:EpsD family peptidyl-prolyl cis-trans isomerase
VRLVAAAGALALAACHGDPPKGQVIATVNGVEITVAELNEEARGRGLDIDGDRAMRDALIKELVERKLLVAEAQAQKLDRTPQFLLAERRGREILLAQQLLSVPAGTPKDGGEQLRAFIAAHPLSFGRRVIVQADQLAVTGAIPAGLRNRLATASTTEQMAELLRGGGMKATRTSERWDSADPTAPVASGEVKPEQGSHFILARPGGTILGTVTTVQPAPVPADQQAAMARALMERGQAEQRMRALLDRAAASARITYNPEFAPPAGEP